MALTQKSKGNAHSLKDLVVRMFKEVEDSVARSPLPESVDRSAISTLIAKAHLEFWKGH
jgi:hypothetical protein